MAVIELPFEPVLGQSQSTCKTYMEYLKAERCVGKRSFGYDRDPCGTITIFGRSAFEFDGS